MRTIYYRENTEIKTPQQYNCDYFTIECIGAYPNEGKAFVTINFWEKEIDALEAKEANSSRNVTWDIVTETSIQSGMDKILSFDNVATTSNDFISLSGAVIIS